MNLKGEGREIKTLREKLLPVCLTADKSLLARISSRTSLQKKPPRKTPKRLLYIIAG
ncbi:MAG: hypothetical protein KKE17_06505 [Proteobacteria bacterium]|nr:hypothetical protein [Pseudomonadota bacterium]MBU1709639.1 hypothetical protein [Pseudomonadota bacterium]